MAFYKYVNDTNSCVDFWGLKCANVNNNVLEIQQKFPKNSKEAKELDEFVKKWNEQIPTGGLTRQAVPKDVRKAASDAATAYKINNPDLFKNGEVAGHIPDVGWGGKTDGPFMPLTPSVNSYIGGATQAIPVGTNYTSVVIIK